MYVKASKTTVEIQKNLINMKYKLRTVIKSNEPYVLMIIAYNKDLLLKYSEPFK